MRRLFLTSSLWVWLPALALADTSENEQRTACGWDVMRLCLSEMPDRARIAECMVSNRSQLSSSCRIVVDAGLAAKRKPR